ncbi:MAG TPA: hypothetical protein VE198_17470 [Actinoallomurus sp.]|nr:hypothetical protein [Actinoallomurus sp.]
MTETVPYARTLVEAYLYNSLTTSAEGLGEDVPRDPRAATTLTEGQDAWTLRYEGGGRQIELLVRYETEDEARRADLRFGSGVSELIDAGQWLQVAAVYARRALREGLFYAQNPTGAECFQGIVEGWELARDATVEAAKFLPSGVDEVPATAIWTPMGATARQESPERFTRDRIERDIAFCQQSLDDFRRLHGAP